METTTGSTVCEGMYSKLIDDEAAYFDELNNSNKDAGYSGPVCSVTVAPQPRGSGPYRCATLCLAMLCAVLFISLIAVTLRYRNMSSALGGDKDDPAGTEAQIQRQKQEANMTALTALVSQLQQEKTKLLAELSVKCATKAPEVVPTVPVTSTTSTVAPTTVVCPVHWQLFNGSCYFISSTMRDWSDSQSYCMENGAHLAIILNAEEQSFLWELLPRGHWNSYWIGISDAHMEDDWKWVDGTHLVGGFWEDGEPNNHIDEDCVYIVKTRKMERVAVKSWYDAPCSFNLPFICEKKIVAAE